MDKRAQVHIVARALNTLECQPSYSSSSENIATLFCHHSWEELRALLDVLLEEAGMQLGDIDIGEISFPAKGGA